MGRGAINLPASTRACFAVVPRCATILLRMRLSYESRELVRVQHMKTHEEVIRRNKSELQRLQHAARTSGPARGAIDDLYLKMAGEIAEAKVANYIAAHRRENLVPTDKEIREICLDLENLVREFWYSPGHSPFPESATEYMLIAPRAEMTLKLAVKEMRIQARFAEQATSPRQGVEHQSGIAKPRENERSAISVDDVDVFELKPNLFGLGINLNHAIKRLAKWRRRDKK